jgi:hypothetical protein
MARKNRRCREPLRTKTARQTVCKLLGTTPGGQWGRFDRTLARACSHTRCQCQVDVKYGRRAATRPCSSTSRQLFDAVQLRVVPGCCVHDGAEQARGDDPLGLRRQALKRTDCDPHAKSDPFRHLVHVDHARREGDQHRSVFRIGLPPGSIRTRPADRPRVAAPHPV